MKRIFSTRRKILEKFSDSLGRADKHCHKVVCGIFSNTGKIISLGQNLQWKTHPLVEPFEKYKNKQYQCLHAEMHAIIQANKTKWNPAKSFLFVMRKRKDGKMGSSKPCGRCQRMIESNGISNVVYYDDKQNLTKNNE